VLKLVHTADWHLGRRFPSFPEEAQKKLSRARMEVVDRILDVARRQRADAVVCAGDVFDEPAPSQEPTAKHTIRSDKSNKHGVTRNFVSL